MQFAIAPLCSDHLLKPTHHGHAYSSCLTLLRRWMVSSRICHLHAYNHKRNSFVFSVFSGCGLPSPLISTQLAIPMKLEEHNLTTVILDSSFAMVALQCCEQMIQRQRQILSRFPATLGPSSKSFSPRDCIPCILPTWPFTILLRHQDSSSSSQASTDSSIFIPIICL